ncbi:MAG: NYN domain-containing protein [Planctomycetaceae bacterium]
MADTERSLALFVDFENLALGFQGSRGRFDIGRVLKRMVEKGKIVAKKAYADWGRYSSYTESLHEAAIELVQIPRRGQTGKNSADIRLCVDAMDLAYSKDHIDTFVVVSGDSDFSPLVSKLKELGKHVIGLGMQPSTSDLLRDNCDEFIYYEDLETGSAEVPKVDPQLPENKRKGFTLLMEALTALRRENKERLWSSMIKDTMKRLKPSFNETYHGYKTFSDMLEDAQAQGILELETDERSGTYVVTRFGDEKVATGTPEHRRRRRRRRRGGGGSAGGGNGPRERAPAAAADENGDRPVESDSVPPKAFDEEFIPWPDE